MRLAWLVTPQPLRCYAADCKAGVDFQGQAPWGVDSWLILCSRSTISVHPPPQSFVLCFSESLLNSNLEKMKSKLSGLCWQIAAVLIRWMKLIEAKLLLGGEWGVQISPEREATRKRDTKLVWRGGEVLEPMGWLGEGHLFRWVCESRQNNKSEVRHSDVKHKI